MNDLVVIELTRGECELISKAVLTQARNVTKLIESTAQLMAAQGFQEDQVQYAGQEFIKHLEADRDALVAAANKFATAT